MNKTVLVKINLENNRESDLIQAYDKVNNIIHEHNELGYKVVSVTPLTASDYSYDDADSKSYGYGYSFTNGIIIVFEKI